uniref:Uncharacterized protein n=1 Tax=Anguilla anguilla TaxID=7936 RepID=A0A0E9TWC1_ANGAN
MSILFRHCTSAGMGSTVVMNPHHANANANHGQQLCSDTQLALALASNWWVSVDQHDSSTPAYQLKWPQVSVHINDFF